MEDNNFINILGYKIFRKSINDAINYIDEFNKIHIISGNPEVLYSGLNNKKLLENFTSDNSFIIPDGVGIQIAAKYIKTPVEEKIAGIDLMKEIIKISSVDNKGIYLIGTTNENLKACVANLVANYPKINILGYKNGYFDINNAEEILQDIKEKKP